MLKICIHVYVYTEVCVCVYINLYSKTNIDTFWYLKIHLEPIYLTLLEDILRCRNLFKHS